MLGMQRGLHKAYPPPPGTSRPKRGGGAVGVRNGRPAYAQPLSPWRQKPISMAFIATVTAPNRFGKLLQPLLGRPLPSNVPSPPMYPCPCVLTILGTALPLLPLPSLCILYANQPHPHPMPCSSPPHPHAIPCLRLACGLSPPSLCPSPCSMSSWHARVHVDRPLQ